MLELDYEGVKRQRCAACARRLFGDEPPVTFPEDSLAVPQPSLPMPVERRPDFVTPRNIRRSKSVTDITSRILGERE